MNQMLSLSIDTEHSIFLNEFVDIGKMTSVLAKLGTSALDGIIHNCRFLKVIGCKRYKTFFDTCVALVLDYR